MKNRPPARALRQLSHATAIPARPWEPFDQSNPINQLPIAVSCMDYSVFKRLFQSLAARGVTDMPSYFAQDMSLFMEAANQLKVVTLNNYHLKIYESPSIEASQKSLDIIQREDLVPGLLARSLAFWRGETIVSLTAKRYRLDGKAVYIRLRASLLGGPDSDWSRVMISSEDITEQEEATKRLAENQRYAEGLFQMAPVSLEVKDFSAMKTMLNAARASGATSCEDYLRQHPGFLQQCLQAIRSVDCNEQTVRLYKAASKQAMLAHLAQAGATPKADAFLSEFGFMWRNRLPYEADRIDYDVEGNRLDLLVQVSVLPGHEHDWSRIHIAKTDLTARKDIERQLEHISHHDVLTGLYNRFYFNNIIEQVRREGPFPSSIIIADLNGLKPVNDRLGHEAGDELLRRAAAVLREASGSVGVPVRLGGDEFALLLPGVPPFAAEQAKASIIKMIASAPRAGLPHLSVSLGCAHCDGPDSIDHMLRSADQFMYQAKRAHYNLA